MRLDWRMRRQRNEKLDWMKRKRKLNQSKGTLAQEMEKVTAMLNVRTSKKWIDYKKKK